VEKGEKIELDEVRGDKARGDKGSEGLSSNLIL